MAIIITGKSKCPLCQQVMEKDQPLKGFPAFLPYDHKFGRYSDAIMHEACFVKEADHVDVEDMYTAYRMILHSRPAGLKSMAEMDAWTREAFQDWPPKNGVVVFQPMFPEESEEGGFWMDADSYREMCEAEEKHDKELKERREYHAQLEHEALRYARDDD